MNLNDFLTSIALSNLSNTIVGSNNTGRFNEEYIPQFVRFINEGLTRISSRVQVYTNSVLIELQENLTQYKLEKKFAWSNDEPADYKYIIDNKNEPFSNDVIKILAVHDTRGISFKLNDRNDANSFFITGPDTLQVPRPEKGIPLSISYWAKHPKILSSGSDILSQKIELQDILSEALIAYVTSKYYSSIGGQDNDVKASTYFSIFNTIMLETTQSDLTGQSESVTTHKLQNRGFV